MRVKESEYGDGEKKKRIKRVDKCLATIKAIISNQNLNQYLVGLTLTSAGKKVTPIADGLSITPLYWKAICQKSPRKNWKKTCKSGVGKINAASIGKNITMRRGIVASIFLMLVLTGLRLSRAIPSI
jgi:hypothetical protein